MNIIFLFIIFYCTFIVHSSVDKSIAGPFDLVFERIEKCPGFEKDEYNFTVKLKKLNRTALAVDMNITMPSPIDRTNKLTVIADQYSNNAWKENYMVKEFENVCATLTQFIPEGMKRILQMAGVKKCPIPKGMFIAKNFLLSFDISMVPVFFYNKYRIKSSLWSNKSKQRKLCLMAFMEFVPKRVRKG